MILPYISLVRTSGQTGPSLFYSTELYCGYNYRNGNKQMWIPEGGNRDQIPLEVSLKLGWDELESLGWTCTSEVGVILLPRLALGTGEAGKTGKTGMVWEEVGMSKKTCPASFPYKVSSRTLLICQMKPY